MDDPFTLGVACGDPSFDGFVLWTRLAPQPISPDGLGGLAGMPSEIPVRWEIATDDAMRNIVRSGIARAPAHFAYSVHVEVTGLAAQRPYWYRFTALGAQSPVGRAVTAPCRNAPLDRLRFAFASCANWEAGYFSAYRHMAQEHPDLIVFLGDYIYDNSRDPRETGGKPVVRPHDGPNATDLVAYRNRYALYRTDADLQSVHAMAPCLMTWDDHEVQDDYANNWSKFTDVSMTSFLKQRAAAYQAFYEHMPLRASSIPRGPDMRIYDRVSYGSLIDFHVIDGRQYRTPQPCPLPTTRGGHVVAESCVDRTEARRTMLGFTQEAWLHDGLRRSSAKWNVMAQDLLFAPLLQKDPRTGAVGHWTDGWDGYPATRERLLRAIAQSRPSNPVIIGGDIHSFWTNDVHLNERPDSPVIATEFVGTSVTSDGPPYDTFASMLPENPHVKYFESRHRGYVCIDVTPERMTTRFRVISDRTDKRATVSTLKEFVVCSGKAGAQAT
ncbi:alkaline phosphatase D family protein [Pandoraea anhela]|nr:alkaline phosphatase D family protein [Pandoraea anhela]